MPRFRNILNLCLSASLSSKVIASHAITESAINTNSQASCYFISQKRALSEIFSYLKICRIFKIPPSSTELCSLREKLSARKFDSIITCSFYLKLSLLGKNRKLHSWDQQQYISLLLPGLSSNPALSTNFSVFPSSVLHLCPLTHPSGSLLSSTPNFSLAGIIPGFKHHDLQSQACHCCQQGAAQWHSSMHPKLIQAQGSASHFTSCQVQGGNRLGPEALQCPHRAVTLMGQQHGHNTQEWKWPCPEEQCSWTRECSQREEQEGPAVHQPYPLQ